MPLTRNRQRNPVFRPCATAKRDPRVRTNETQSPLRSFRPKSLKCQYRLYVNGRRFRAAIPAVHGSMALRNFIQPGNVSRSKLSWSRLSRLLFLEEKRRRFGSTGIEKGRARISRNILNYIIARFRHSVRLESPAVSYVGGGARINGGDSFFFLFFFKSKRRNVDPLFFGRLNYRPRAGRRGAAISSPISRLFFREATCD